MLESCAYLPGARRERRTKGRFLGSSYILGEDERWRGWPRSKKGFSRCSRDTEDASHDS